MIISLLSTPTLYSVNIFELEIKRLKTTVRQTMHAAKKYMQEFIIKLFVTHKSGEDPSVDKNNKNKSHHMSCTIE